MKNITTIITILWFTLLLSACSGLNFAPEDAARNATLNQASRDFQLNTNSVQVIKTERINDSSAIVLVTFQGMRNRDPNLETCVYTYQVINRPIIGWQPSSGGGGCSGAPADAPEQEIDFGSGTSSGDSPNDPGLSEVYGIVHKPEIVKVQVTWEDNEISEVDVTNSGFIAYRFGEHQLKNLNGFDQQGESVYEYTREQAPGKKE